MEALETHLIGEIDYLVKQENISVEEASRRVINQIGGREMLDKEFTKIKPRLIIVKNWFRSNLILLLVVVSIILVFSITDSIFSQKNFLEQYEPKDKMITCSNMTKASRMDDFTINLISNLDKINRERNVEYIKTHPFESKYKNNYFKLYYDSSYFVSTSIYSSQFSFMNQQYQFYLDEENNFLVSQFSSLFYKTPLLIKLVPDEKYLEKSQPEIYNRLKKGSKTNNGMNSTALFSNITYMNYTGRIFIIPKSIYKFAVNQSWYDQAGESYYIETWEEKSVKSIFDIQISEEKLNETIVGRSETEENINMKFQPFVLQKLNNSSFVLASNQDGQMHSVRIQLSCHPVSNVPILLSEEVKLVRKPIHILPYVINRIGDKFVKSKS